MPAGMEWAAETVAEMAEVTAAAEMAAEATGAVMAGAVMEVEVMAVAMAEEARVAAETAVARVAEATAEVAMAAAKVAVTGAGAKAEATAECPTPHPRSNARPSAHKTRGSQRCGGCCPEPPRAAPPRGHERTPPMSKPAGRPDRSR